MKMGSMSQRNVRISISHLCLMGVQSSQRLLYIHIVYSNQIRCYPMLVTVTMPTAIFRSDQLNGGFDKISFIWTHYYAMVRKHLNVLKNYPLLFRLPDNGKDHLNTKHLWQQFSVCQIQNKTVHLDKMNHYHIMVLKHFNILENNQLLVSLTRMQEKILSCKKFVAAIFLLDFKNIW